MTTAKKTPTKPKKAKTKALLNPQQNAFLAAYLNPESPTYGNSYQSALAVGYSEEYAQNLTALKPEWLSVNIGKSDKSSEMLEKAERNLNELLDWNTTVPAIGAFGPVYEKVIGEDGKETKIPVYKTNTEMLKIKADATKFVAERLGRAKYGQKELPGSGASQVINYQLFYNPTFQSTIQNAEAEMKRLIIDAPTSQTPQSPQ